MFEGEPMTAEQHFEPLVLDELDLSRAAAAESRNEY
jgi:hypothetical protein